MWGRGANIYQIFHWVCIILLFAVYRHIKLIGVWVTISVRKSIIINTVQSVMVHFLCK